MNKFIYSSIQQIIDYVNTTVSGPISDIANLQEDENPFEGRKIITKSDISKNPFSMTKLIISQRKMTSPETSCDPFEGSIHERYFASSCEKFSLYRVK